MTILLWRIKKSKYFLVFILLFIIVVLFQKLVYSYFDRCWTCCIHALNKFHCLLHFFCNTLFLYFIFIHIKLKVFDINLSKLIKIYIFFHNNNFFLFFYSWLILVNFDNKSARFKIFNWLRDVFNYLEFLFFTNIILGNSHFWIICWNIILIHILCWKLWFLYIFIEIFLKLLIFDGSIKSLLLEYLFINLGNNR